MSQPERNTTVNAGPPIEPAPHIGARVAVHGFPFFDGEPGTVIAVDEGRPPEYRIVLDNEPTNPHWFWRTEMEAIDV